jgi:ribonuclease D
MDTTADDQFAPDSAPVLHAPADGVPAVVADAAGLQRSAAAIAAGTGPVAIDAERASGHRYHQRAYLVQLRREGSGTHLIDPIALDTVEPLAAALSGTEWILHAATQDLPCLRELGLQPTRLFDTELAGRLLGLPRVGLAGLAEDVLGVGLAKGHGAADWSRRPLPPAWLAYAALDVELLAELREDLLERLRRAHRLPWAQQEFDALLTWQPRPQPEGWLRLRGLNRLRDPRDLAVARQLWHARDRIARRADQPPGRILPDAAIVAAARARPASPSDLSALPEFARQRKALPTWWRAVEQARGLPDSELPSPARPEQIPSHRAWANHRPAAAAALSSVRAAVGARAEELGIAHEVLVPPDAVRALVWHHCDEPIAAGQAAELLAGYGARRWQTDQLADDIAAAWPTGT